MEKNLSEKSTLNISRDKMVRERHFAHWSGRPFRELHSLSSDSGVKYPNYTPPGVETVQELRKRSSDFFGLLSKKIVDEAVNMQSVSLSPDARYRLGLSSEEHATNFDATVLLVTHGGIVRELLTDLHDRELVHGEIPVAGKRLAPNCGYTTMVVHSSGKITDEIGTNDPISWIEKVHLATINAVAPDPPPVVTLQ